MTANHVGEPWQGETVERDRITIQINLQLKYNMMLTQFTCIPTIVRKMPNSGLISTTSPSVNTNCFFLSFLAPRITAICCAATDRTGSSILLNSSKHPHDPD
jgi:hypothetical protein